MPLKPFFFKNDEMSVLIIYSGLSFNHLQLIGSVTKTFKRFSGQRVEWQSSCFLVSFHQNFRLTRALKLEIFLSGHKYSHGEVRRWGEIRITDFTRKPPGCWDVIRETPKIVGNSFLKNGFLELTDTRQEKEFATI